MSQKFIQDFENVLNQVLSYYDSCEGEVGKIRIEKDTRILTRIGMSKGLAGYLYVIVPERVKPEDIKPFLKKNEKINFGYMKFTSKGREPQSFYVTSTSKRESQNLLSVDEGKFSTFVEEENGREYINKRTLEIVKNYLAVKQGLF